MTRAAWCAACALVTIGLACSSGKEDTTRSASGGLGASSGGAAETARGGTNSGCAESGGARANGGAHAQSGGAQSGGARSSGGAMSSTAGGPHEGGEAGAGATSTEVCDDPALVWRSANKTNYTSYPDPGSDECIKFNGCMWEGQFAGCDGVKSEAWVAAHNIVAAFPDFATLQLHQLCLRKGSKTIVVTVYDTCGDSDCDGCCTQNKGSADQLIDVESYTDARWGVPDGMIEWADLGPASGDACR